MLKLTELVTSLLSGTGIGCLSGSSFGYATNGGLGFIGSRASTLLLDTYDFLPAETTEFDVFNSCLAGANGFVISFASASARAASCAICSCAFFFASSFRFLSSSYLLTSASISCCSLSLWASCSLIICSSLCFYNLAYLLYSLAICFSRCFCSSSLICWFLSYCSLTLSTFFFIVSLATEATLQRLVPRADQLCCSVGCSSG